MHCASLGEYEQGLPVLKSLQAENPDSFYLVTFFSPSGYHVKKAHQVADITTYLPWDNRSDIRRFINHLQPAKVLFIKYEFWPNLLRELHKQQVPTYLIAGLFQSSQVFFKPWGGWFRKLLRGFTHIFVQDEESQQLLHKYWHQPKSLFLEILVLIVCKQQKQDLSFMKTFVMNRKCIVAGSTWSQDIDVLKEAIDHTPKGWCWLIAPHEINKQQLLKLMGQLPSTAQRYTTAEKHNYRMHLFLSSTPLVYYHCYHYGHIAYVGGAMGGSGLAQHPRTRSSWTSRL